MAQRLGALEIIGVSGPDGSDLFRVFFDELPSRIGDFEVVLPSTCRQSNNEPLIYQLGKSWVHRSGTRSPHSTGLLFDPLDEGVATSAFFRQQ